jgi:hypothetical protein
MKRKTFLREQGPAEEGEQDSSSHQSILIHGCVGDTECGFLNHFTGCLSSARMECASGVYPPPWERFGSGTALRYT